MATKKDRGLRWHKMANGSYRTESNTSGAVVDKGLYEGLWWWRVFDIKTGRNVIADCAVSLAKAKEEAVEAILERALKLI